MEPERSPFGSTPFGVLLRRYRLAAGLSQAALAERARISANGLGALERGYRRIPQRGTLGLLAEALALNAAQREELERSAARPQLPRHQGKGSVTSGPWIDLPATHLPLALATLFGRKSEIKEVAATVRAHRLVTLTGSAGIGKTRTALAVAGLLRERDDADVRLVELAALSDASQAAAAIAASVGAQQAPDRSLLDVLVAYLRHRTLLVLLDNCEHVIDEAARVAEALLRSCPGVRVLATSRERLKVAGERAYRLPSLEMPSAERARQLRPGDETEFPAIALFADRARAVEHRFALTIETIPLVAAICRRLDGIPLAIELAAARVGVLPLDALAKRLEERFDVLTSGERNVLPRQRAMRATIDWSVALLSEPERVLLRRLGAFSGGCTLEAAEAVCGDEQLDRAEIFEHLSSLVEKSLVTMRFSAEFRMVDVEGRAGTDRWPRYGLLESIRAYAVEELVAAGEDESVARRHAEWAADYGEWLQEFRFYNIVRFHREAPFPDVFEMANRQQALVWALAADDAVLAGRIGGTHPWFDLTIDILSRLEAALEKIEATNQRTIEARLLVALSEQTELPFNATSVQQRAERGLEAARTAVALLEASGERGHWFALALGKIADWLPKIGCYEEALAARDRYFQARVDLGAAEVWYRGYWLADRGAILQNLGQYNEALDALSEALPLAEFRVQKLVWGSLFADVVAAQGDFLRAAMLGDDLAGTVPREEWSSLEGGERWPLIENRTNAVAYRLMLGDEAMAREAALDAVALSHERWGGIAIPTHVCLATLGALAGEVERSARLKGYIDAAYARLRELREPTNERTYRRLVAALEERLQGPEIERLVNEGAVLDERQADELASALAHALRATASCSST